jgi:hypothetical protein
LHTVCLVFERLPGHPFSGHSHPANGWRRGVRCVQKKDGIAWLLLSPFIFVSAGLAYIVITQ